MVSNQMDNPYAVGDLVHLPSGVVLYGTSKNYVQPMPVKVIERPAVALVMNKFASEYYSVSIGEDEFLVRKEAISLVSRKGMR